jgi:hypothetical protein
VILLESLGCLILLLDIPRMVIRHFSNHPSVDLSARLPFRSFTPLGLFDHPNGQGEVKSYPPILFFKTYRARLKSSSSSRELMSDRLSAGKLTSFREWLPYWFCHVVRMDRVPSIFDRFGCCLTPFLPILGGCTNMKQHRVGPRYDPLIPKRDGCVVSRQNSLSSSERVLVRFDNNCYFTWLF